MADTDRIKELEKTLETYKEALTKISKFTPFTGSVDAKAVFDAANLAKEALGIK